MKKGYIGGRSKRGGVKKRVKIIMVMEGRMGG